MVYKKYLLDKLTEKQRQQLANSIENKNIRTNLIGRDVMENINIAGKYLSTVITTKDRDRWIIDIVGAKKNAWVQVENNEEGMNEHEFNSIDT